MIHTKPYYKLCKKGCESADFTIPSTIRWQFLGTGVMDCEGKPLKSRFGRLTR
jgi:hypothetical protein